MALASGNRLGPYEISVSIGAGGMGEVYKARDARLKRDVAIKVLPESFAADADRLRRFQLEAQSAGALNHPNILVVYDIGSEDHSPYLVSELLEGETLRDRLRQGKLPAAKAIDYARQIASGLAAAHSKGITHRDIKPENLFITKDNRVKILDFGLAKVSIAEKPADDSPTETRGTDPGAVMGTASYMSPEQVRAQPVDYRSDIFSLGCVLFEMLSGKRAFQRDTSVETMNAILKEDPPDLTALDSTLPPVLDRIVRHCLEKNPDDRFQSTRDLAFDLESLSQTSQSRSPATKPVRAARRWVIWAMVAAIPIAVAAGVLLDRRLTKPAVVKTLQLTFRRGRIGTARFAPDGHTIVYSAQWEDQPIQLFTVRDDGPDSRPLGAAGTGLFAISSRSELAVGLNMHGLNTFVDEGTLARGPFSGGEPRPLLDNVRYADWSPDGADLAVVVENSQGWRIEFPPGKLLYQGSSPGYLSDVRFSPDGAQVAFIEHPTSGSDGYITVVDRSRHKKVLTPWYTGNAQGLAWSPKGDEIWFTATKGGSHAELRAVTLDGKDRLISKQLASLVLQDVAKDGRILLGGAMEFRTRIFYRGAADANERELSGLDWSLIRDISSNGKIITFDESGEGAGGSVDAYLRDVNAPSAVKLGPGYYPTLSPDGKSVLTVAPDAGSIIIYPVGLGETKQVVLKGFQIDVGFFVPNSKKMVVFASETGHGSRLYLANLDGSKPRPISPEGVNGLRSGGPSPDGKYIPALSSDGEIHLYALDGSGSRNIAGIQPADRIAGWAADSKNIFIYQQAKLPAGIYRLNFETGKREFLREVAPVDRAGVASALGIRITPDGKSYAYSPSQILNELHLVEGLK